MVNIADILAQKQRSADLSQSKSQIDPKILTMDVVDLLRKERELTGHDLTETMSEDELSLHLQSIYEAQGIDIIDDVVIDGIAAYKDQRYVYQPPRKGLSRKLALLYINRRKWLPLLLTLTLIFGSITAINYVGFVRPQKVESERIEKLIAQTLPDNLAEKHAAAIEIAATDDLKSQADQLLALGQDALDKRDVQTAQRMSQELATFSDDLRQAYQIRIVSRPGEYSGVFRINHDGGQEVRNYYLIVEGVAADGNLVNVQITSEEDQRTKRTKIWGVRVSENVFNRVAADKRDDQIIQDAIIGQKQRGHLTPEYSTETLSGLILDW